MQLNIDLALFIGFLLLNLIVGLWYGRGVKNIKDYALGGRNFSTVALVSTIVATSATGSMFFVDLENVYSQGLLYIIATSAVSIQFLLLGFVLIPRMGEFMGALSVAEIMGNLYGNKVRGITAICGILLNIGYIAVQFKVFGSLVNYFAGVSHNLAVVIGAAIVILYSSFGGIKAVTYTDVLQFFTFGFVVPMIGIVIWDDFHSKGLTVSNALNNPIFDYKQLMNLNGKELLSFICLIIYFSFPTMAPTDFQRISMGRSINQVKKAFVVSMFIFIAFGFVIAWIPFLISNINPSLPANEVAAFVINNYASVGLKSLIIIGVSAMAMSSADSFINGSSVLFAYDLKEALGIKINNLTLSKVFAIILGIFGIYLALSTDNLLSMVMNSASFYMAVAGIPIICSILGFRSSTQSVLAAMIVSFITVITLILLKIEETIIPGMIVNGVVLFGYHYLFKQQGGWIAKDNIYLMRTRNERKRKIDKFISSLSLSSLVSFCKKTAPKDEMMYTWLGIYCIFYTLSTMYSTQRALSGIHGNTILTIYKIMMCTGVITAMYPIWPTKIKHEIVMQVAWNIIIFYMLIFFSCFFVMLSDFGSLQFAIFTINLVITAILVGWKLSIVTIPIGFYLSTVLYKNYMGIDSIDISIGSPSFIFMYTLMLVGSSLIIFLKPKEDQYALAEAKNEHLTARINEDKNELSLANNIKNEFIRNITHEYNNPLSGIISTLQILKKAYHKLDDNLRLEAVNIIQESALKLEHFDDNLQLLSKLSGGSYKLLINPMDLSDLVKERVSICRSLYISKDTEYDREFILDIKENIIAQLDQRYFTKALDNLIINAITYCKEGKIIITLEQKQYKIQANNKLDMLKDSSYNKYNREFDNTIDSDIKNNNIIFTIEDEGIGIPKEELYDIFGEFIISSRTKTPAGGRGIGLALVKRVVEVHGGRVWAESEGTKGAKFVIILDQ